MAVFYCKFNPHPRYGFRPGDTVKRRGALDGEKPDFKMVKVGEVFRCSRDLPSAHRAVNSPPMYEKATEADWKAYTRDAARRVELEAELKSLAPPLPPTPAVKKRAVKFAKKDNNSQPEVIGPDLSGV